MLVASGLTLLRSEDPFPVKDKRLLENQDTFLTSSLVVLVTSWVLWQSVLGLSTDSTASLRPLIQSHMVCVRAVPVKTF